ncbi:MAG: helix-turn-helix domain-containing protein [Myxococcota bacterium]|jgi:hypothetical protein|nr:helix-turn-helix domain-containing protein [Myxococcota bacterium]
MMSQGFYELLGVDEHAEGHQVRAAYENKLAKLVARLKAARRQDADVTVLEAQERELREAMQVLVDPSRRRRYDTFRKACVNGLPTNEDELWQIARGSLVDPAASAALTVVRALTDLPLGSSRGTDPGARPTVPAAPPPIEPALAPVSAALPPLPTPPPVIPIDPTPAVVETDLTDPAQVQAIVQRLGTDGRCFRELRETRGLSLTVLAETTRIAPRHLQAIEDNAFDRLPSPTFVRGYLKEILRALEVDKDPLVDGYMAMLSVHRDG